MKKKTLLTVVLATIISAVIITSTPNVNASTAVLKILPVTNTYYINMAPPNSVITLNITVADVTDLFSWQVMVQWDPSMLNYSDIFLPPDHVFTGKAFFPVSPDVDYTSGTVVYAVALGPGTTSFNGTGTLCQLNLTILEPTTLPISCELTFLHPPPYPLSDTFLLNSMGLDISFDIEKATYTYALMKSVSHTVTYLGESYTVGTYSNASITPNTIQVNGTAKMITFNVTGFSGNTAFVNVTIPKNFINASATQWKVYANGTELSALQIQVSENTTHTFVYATFPTSLTTVGVQGIWIVPEMPNVLLIFLAISTTLVFASKIRTRKKQ